MKLSQKCNYALWVMLDLSNHYLIGLVHISDLAARQNIPPKYLGQVLLQLKSGGFIQSKKGPRGGYGLARPPAQIWLGDVMRQVEGPLFAFTKKRQGEPASDMSIFNTALRETFFGVQAEIEAAVGAVIDNITLANIQKREAEALARENVGDDYYI